DVLELEAGFDVGVGAVLVLGDLAGRHRPVLDLEGALPDLPLRRHLRAGEVVLEQEFPRRRRTGLRAQDGADDDREKGDADHRKSSYWGSYFLGASGADTKPVALT